MAKRAVLLAVALTHLLTLLALGAVGLLEMQMAYASPYVSIDVDTAYDMITNGSFPNLVVLDVRTQSEYDNGYITSAVGIPLSELETRIGELAGHENHEIIVYCDCIPPGGASEIASGILDSYNFTQVYHIVAEFGAYTEWQSRGYPIIPEFPSLIILPLFMAATLLVVIVHRRKQMTPKNQSACMHEFDVVLMADSYGEEYSP